MRAPVILGRNGWSVSRDVNSGIGASTAELFAVFALMLAYSTADPFSQTGWTTYLNIAGPVWLCAVLFLGALRIARNVAAGMWTALFWFRVATAVYFCIGSLVPFFGAEATRTYIEALFSFQPQHILKLNMITALSVLIVLGTSKILEGVFGPPKINRRDAANEVPQERSPIVAFAFLFLLLGDSIKYLLIFPNQMGWTETVVPGVLITLSDSTLIGYYLLTIWSLEGRQRYFFLVALLVLLEMTIGLLTFNKASVMFPLMVVSLGVLRKNVTLKRGAAVAAVMVTSISFLQPLVSHVRLVQAMRFESSTGGTLEQRVQILQSYFDPARTIVDEQQVEQTLARISYVNVAAFVIDQYERGFTGSSFDGGLTMLVPRFLWPDKPIFLPGADLWMLMTGLEGNQVAAGVFAEAYWNYGWLGVVLSMALLGAILFWLSRLAISVMQREAWIFMPVLFMGMKMGVRIDGTFVVDVVGAAAIAAVIAGICATIDRSLILGAGRMPIASRRGAGI
jgi:hypothetical protein